MDYKYFVCVTDEGRKLIANAIATETNIDFTHMSVGDANGTSYDPEPGMNALKHEVYKAEIGSIKTNAEDNNILEFEFIVPASSGGYYIREAALYAGETVCAIARLPEQYKAQASEGAGSSMTVKLLIAVTSDAKVYINIPESLQYATQTYVGERIKNHVDEDNPHTQYVKNETYTEGINELKNNKAEKTHNHDDIYSKLNHNHNDIYSQLNHNHNGVYSNANHNHELSSLNGVLPVNKGGTGASNINDARKNLGTFNQARLPNKADLNNLDLYEKDRIVMNLTGFDHVNRPEPNGAQTGAFVTYIDTVNNRGWQRFYQAGHAENGSFTEWGRLYGYGKWQPWILFRNRDGSVPNNIKTYSTRRAVWTENPINAKTTALTGYGSGSTENVLPKRAEGVFTHSDNGDWVYNGIIK